MGMPQTKPPYTYGGKTFRTLGAIQDHVMVAIDYHNRVVGREFFDAVLADLIVDRHYIWRQRGIRPTSFQYLLNLEDDGRGWDDSLAGYFGLEWEWQRFSYRKALKQKEPDLESEFSRLCRERWRFTWRDRLFVRGRCQSPGCRETAVDVDHVTPQHKDIEVACWAKVVAVDKASWWYEMVYGDGDKSHFRIPDGHPVAEEYDRLTAGGTFQSLCKEHHKGETRGRRGVPSPSPVESKPFEVFVDPGLADLFGDG